MIGWTSGSSAAVSCWLRCLPRDLRASIVIAARMGERERWVWSVNHLPEAEGQVIITSRCPGWDGYATMVRMGMKPLEPSESIRMLARARLGTRRIGSPTWWGTCPSPWNRPPQCWRTPP